MSKKTEPEKISLSFHLDDLPTAQHRAGLAGLLLQIESMGKAGNKRDAAKIPEVKPGDVTATRATITFTRESMQGVFDDLYAGRTEPILVAARWPGKTRPKSGEFFLAKKDPKTREIKQVPGFGYDVVVPQGPCLSRHLEGGFQSPWHALWRQMTWSIPRGGNNVRSRAPFIELANGKDHCGDGATAWAQAVDFDRRISAQSAPPTAPIAGALMLGAQAINAESVPFTGRVDQNLLLHFWQVVVSTYAPQLVNKKEGKVERVGYVLAIPDVADLAAFCRHFPSILQGLEAGEHPGRTPRQAMIDLPDQASLEVLRRLTEVRTDPATMSSGAPGDGPPPGPTSRADERIARRRQAERIDSRGTIRDLAASDAAADWSGTVRAVESYHMLKLGNNVKLLSFSRLAGRPGLIRKYKDISGNYRSPLFRAARMRALIRGEPWHSAMIPLFAGYPWPFFIEHDETPKYLPRFGRDARLQFQAFRGSTEDMEIEAMDEDDKLKHLSLIIHRVINRYVERRAEKKYGRKVSDFSRLQARDKEGKPIKRKGGDPLMVPDFPREFREHQQRVCTDAFLGMRSRHDQDFVEYFAGTICSVDHQLSRDDYRFLVGFLMTNPDPNPVGPKRLCRDDVKAIAMIALSACSFQVRVREPENQGSPS